MAFRVEQARCNSCRCQTAHYNLSRHGLCVVCEPRSEELHAQRVFLKRPQREQSIILARVNSLPLKQRKA